MSTFFGVPVTISDAVEPNTVALLGTTRLELAAPVFTTGGMSISASFDVNDALRKSAVVKNVGRRPTLREAWQD